MPRLPKLRVHYAEDAQFLLRLAHAIELDDKRDVEWKKDKIERLQALAADLLQAA